MATYHIVKPSSHEGWLEERKKGIGSSEVGAILGVSRFSTPMKVWAKKIGLVPPEEESFVMKAGHELEPAVAHWFASCENVAVIAQSEGDWLAVDNEKPFLRVSPDRLFYYLDEDPTAENLCILECKSTSMKVDRESIPESWYWQVQYQMGVMGIRRSVVAWLSCYGGRFSFDYREIPFVAEHYDAAKAALVRFWEYNVLQRQQPDKVLSQEDALLKWPKPQEGSSLVADERICSLVDEYNRLDADVKLQEKRMDEISLEIRTVMEDKESLVNGQDEVLATYKATTSSKFNGAAFKEANPEGYKEYEKYVTKTPTRTLKFKKPKRKAAGESASA